MTVDRRERARGEGARKALRMSLRLVGTSTAASPLSLAIAIAFSTLPAPVYSQAASGFNFCVAPPRPACVFETSNRAAGACDREVEAYVGVVFRYRECLEAESERAVRESNDVIDHWRCRQNGERCRN